MARMDKASMLPVAPIPSLPRPWRRIITPISGLPAAWIVRPHQQRKDRVTSSPPRSIQLVPFLPPAGAPGRAAPRRGGRLGEGAAHRLAELVEGEGLGQQAGEA